MVGIVTVLYNSTLVLLDFFQSLEAQTCRNFTLYIVDNASPDNSLQQAHRLAKTVSFSTVFIENTHNGGIAQGNNLGIRAAKRDGCNYILLSNNDTVWSPDTLSSLLRSIESTDYQIVVPKILYHDTGKIWYAGGTWNRLRGGTLHFKHERIRSPHPVDYAPSCCMLIHSDIINLIGTMDERFFLYYDDTDFVRRVQNKGLKILYSPQVVITHKEGSSIGSLSPTSQYWLSRNLLIFTQKHRSIFYLYYILFVSFTVLFTKGLFTFNRPVWLSTWYGIIDGMRICHSKQLEINYLQECQA